FGGGISGTELHLGAKVSFNLSEAEKDRLKGITEESGRFLCLAQHAGSVVEHQGCHWGYRVEVKRLEKDLFVSQLDLDQTLNVIIDMNAELKASIVAHTNCQ
ncbi:hypothetical protein V8G54_000060, partial (mitochondrion) [Vigna mungo]